MTARELYKKETGQDAERYTMPNGTKFGVGTHEFFLWCESQVNRFLAGIEEIDRSIQIRDGDIQPEERSAK